MAMNMAVSQTKHYALAVLLSIMITSLLLLVDPALEVATIVMAYLLGVLVIATSTGLGPGILTSLLGFLAFNFFFVAPRYSFHVADPQNLLHLSTFLTVAIVASTLAARARSAADHAQRRATELAALYQLSQTISAQVDLGQILPVIATTTRRLLNVPACWISLYNPSGQLVERASTGTADPGCRSIQVPIRDGPAVLGVLRVIERAPGAGLSDEQRQLLDTLAAQARLAIDRARLVEQTTHNQVLSESDRLKSALLASVTHDLRTPLAIVKGATSTLLADDVAWDAATQRGLTRTIDQEIDHLNRIVGNLLDMSRVEAGALPAERDWHDLAEVLGAALEHLEARLAERRLCVEISPDLPLVLINPTLIELVLANLLENAVKYSAPGTAITIGVRCDGPAEAPIVVVSVRDQGRGLSPGDLARVFEKFYRGPVSAGQAAGVGLGLAICKGILEAHGGRIWAENGGDGGAVFSFSIPHTAAPAR